MTRWSISPVYRPIGAAGSLHDRAAADNLPL
jgi:hypothetical protein